MITDIRASKVFLLLHQDESVASISRRSNILKLMGNFANLWMASKEFKLLKKEINNAIGRIWIVIVNADVMPVVANVLLSSRSKSILSHNY
jgi:hypothetical protein